MTRGTSGVAVMLVVVASGCAATGSSSAQWNKVSTEVAQLDARVTALEQHQTQAQADPATWSTDAATADAPRAPLPKPTTRRIQRALKQAGFYDGEVDGRLGPKTKQAIKDFQKANELRDDGVVGNRTWIKLSAHLPSE